jgi:hypothetical protein
MYLDIEKIKREVSMAQILDYYGIELKKKGKLGLYGSCPIHYGDNQNAFHVDLGKNLFHCFSHCGGGSIFDFGVEVHHPYLIRRGIDEKLASFFQIRYDSYGWMKDRIVIPIMDRYKKQKILSPV